MSESTKYWINEIGTACLMVGAIIFFTMLGAPQ